MEIRQLQYFLKVARLQHVTKAAEELHVAQSAVSRQIHQLEEELGVTLFLQKGRNLQLTPAGRLFMERVEEILDSLEKAVYEVHEYLDPEAGEVRIGFPHTLGIKMMPLAVSHFKKTHPNVTFFFKQGRYDSLIEDVVNGETDLAMISPLPTDDDRVEGDLVLTEELYAILPPEHRLAGESSLNLRQLKDENFVLFIEGYTLRRIVWDACVKEGFKPNIAFEGEEASTIRGLVAAGMGVSLLPEIALFDSSIPDPIKIKITEPKVTRTIGLIRRKDEKLPLVAEAFRKSLLDYYRDGNKG